MKKLLNLAEVLFVGLLFLTSCEIGLGSAVDTQPPTITITSPSDSYIVRENFSISGGIADDMGVSRVEVLLRNTETGATYILPNASVNNETGVWSTYVHAVDKSGETVINYIIPDGNYTATATAYDSYDQTNIATKTFAIDNTPPLLVLKTPSTAAADIESGTMYGQNFYLDGTAADDSYVSTIDVVITNYDKETGEKTSIKRTIPKSNVTSLENVSFFRWGESDYFYDDLYGIENHTEEGRNNHKNDGDKYYYFTINSYDNARKLPYDPNDRGNVANHFYFYSYGEEYFGTKVLSQYKATGTYHLTNGTFKSSDAVGAVSTSVADAVNLLNTAKKTEGSFRLNPVNNPVFTVSGYDQVRNYTPAEIANGVLNATKSQFSIGGSMAITFTQGNDSYSLMPETFGIQLIEADSDGNIKADGNVYYLLEPWKTVAVDADGNPLHDAEGKEYLVPTGTNRTSTGGGNGDIKSSGNSYTISIPLTNGATFPGTKWDSATNKRVPSSAITLKEGYYWVHVTGYDQNGLDVKNNVKAVGMSFDDGPYGTGYKYNYGVQLMGNAQAPSLEILDPLAATNYVAKSGTLTVKSKIGNNSEAAKNMGVNVYLGAVNNSNIVAGSNKTIPNVPASGTDSSYTFTIPHDAIAKAAGNADPANPDKNGEVTVIVMTYYVDQPTLTCQRQFSISYDCTAPVFESISITPVVNVDGTDYVNGTVKIKANITDNAITTAQYSLDGGTTKVSIPNISSGFTLNTTNTTISDALNANRLRLYAKDTAGNETEYMTPASGENPAVAGIKLDVDQTTDAPVIALNNASSALASDADIANAVTTNAAITNIFGGSNNKIIGTVTEDDGFTSVKYTLQKIDKAGNSVGSPDSGNLPCSGTTSVNLNIPLNGNVKTRYNLTIEAVDSAKEETGYNNKTVGPIRIVVDDENPVIANVKAGGKVYSPTEQLYTKSNSTLAISGTVSDDSGEVTVKRYSVYDADKGVCTGDGIAVIVNADGSWSENLSVGTTDDVTVYYQAEDPYGKKSVQKINYKLDDAEPVPVASATVSGTAYAFKVGSKTLTELTDAANPVWYNSTDVVFEGLYKEEQSGIKTIEYYVKATGDANYPATPNGTISTSDLGSYENYKSTISNFKVSNGTNHNSIKFIAEDYAGNKNESEYVIRIDENPPEIGTAIEYQYETGSFAVLDGAVLTNGTKSITLKGTYNDDASGVEKVELYIDGTKQIETVTLTPAAVGNSGTWTVTMAASKFAAYADGSNHPALLKVTDKAGNKGNSNSFSIKVDKTAPTVSVTTPVANATINGNVTITGTTAETNTRQFLAIKYKVGTAPTGIDDTELIDGPSIVRGVNGKEAADIKNWSLSLNATTILKKYNSDNSTNYATRDLYIVFQATDEAGNDSTTNWSSADYIKYTISLDADRPLIKFSNLSAKSGAALKYTSSLTGSVTDDDGINHLYYSSTNHTLAEWRAKGTGIQEVVLSSGSFSIDNLADGPQSFFFYIEDTDKEAGSTYGGEYFTNQTNATYGSLYTPKVQFKQSNGSWTPDPAADDTDGISFTVDNAPPVVGTSTISYSNAADGTYSAAESISSFTSKVGGTVRQFIKLSVKAKDDNGITSVAAKLDGYATPYSMTTDHTKDASNFETFEIVINLSDLAGDGSDVKAVSGTKSIVFTITDGSGITTSTDPVSVTIDNDGPIFNIANPKKESDAAYAAEDLANKDDSLVVTGVVQIIGSISDNSTVADFKFKALNKTTAASDTTAKAAVDAESTVSFAAGSGNTGSLNSWTISVKGLPGSIGELADYSAPIVHNTTTDLYAIPVYFWAADDLGNETYYKTYELKYDPFGDRPSAEISTPNADANLNGTIQILGSSMDNESVDSVYIQIDVDQDGDFDAADRDALIAMENESITNADGSHTIYTVYTQGEVSGAVQITDGNFEADDQQSGCGFWGIKANRTTSWNISVNKYKELQIASSRSAADSNKYTIYYRACALDNHHKMGNWTSTKGTANARKFTIDTNIPQLSQGGTIIGYSNSGRTTKDGYQKDYAADMFLTTNGRYNSLKINITDKNGVEKLEYYTARTIEDLASATTPVTINPTVANPTNWDVEIPLNKLPSVANKKDSLAIKVVAYKHSDVETTAYCNYNINFDDVAPRIDSFTLNSSEYEAGSVDRIVNSNGIFTLGGKVFDEDSGFDRVAFYYYRKSAANGERIYEPLTPKATNKWTVNSAALDGSVQEFGQPGEKQKMFGVQKTVSVAADKKTITLSGADSKIFAGGLVYISGAWLRIADVSGTTITLDASTPAAEAGSGKTAFFPYVRVIDNTGAEKSNWSSDITSAATFDNDSDDGDGMPESIIKSQSTWTYDASIRSNFIPDGPGTMVIFVFDKAGNISAKSYEASVQNNAPRITKLHLGTDLNGSGTYTDNEFETYDILSVAGAQSSYTLTTKDYLGSSFKVLDGMVIAPEFTGGNGSGVNGALTAGDIKMIFNRDASAETGYNKEPDYSTTPYGAADKVSGLMTALNGTALEAVIPAENTKVTRSNINIYKFVNNQTSGAAPAVTYNQNWVGDESTAENITNSVGDRAVSFTFWDKTEDTVMGQNSCFCYLKIDDLIVNVVDTVPPKVVVDPFYWNDADDNSLCKDDEGNPAGHIDLSEDWKTTSSYSATNALLDADPKVSGKIIFRGTVYDEHSVGELWAKFVKASDETSIFVPGNSGSADTDGFYKMASIEGGVWTGTTGTVDGTNWTFEVGEPEYSGQAGTKYPWTLMMDTNGITDHMANDVEIYMMAKDGANNSSYGLNGSAVNKTATADSARHIPYYQVDVVPYITGFKNGNEVSNRSKLGRYPVHAGSSNTFTIVGWNFGTSSTPAVYRGKPDGTDGTNRETLTLSGTPTGTEVTVKCPEYSGPISLYWSSTGYTLNNLNSEPSKSRKTASGKTTNKALYNIEAGELKYTNNTALNGTSAEGVNYWTDDRYISVWNNTIVPDSTSPFDGVVRKVEAKNSNNNKFYKMQSTSGVNDVKEASDIKDGQWHATWSSPDLLIYTTASTTKYKKFRTLWNSSEAMFLSTPARYIDNTMIGGQNWYIVRDEYLGGNSGNTWGAGMFIGREGFSFPKGQWNGGQVLDTAKNVCERQGKDQPVHTRNPATGYDSYTDQFINPKITGWFNPESVSLPYNGNNKIFDGTTYIYVCYYDTFTRCLKYGAFKEGFDVSAVSSPDGWGGINGSLHFSALVRTADNMTKPQSVVAGVDRMYLANDFSIEAGEDCGEWSDIMVDPSDHNPVIIYYNRTRGTLELLHGKNAAPTTANYKAAQSDATPDTIENADGWYRIRSITPKAGIDFGRYVSAEVDSNGNIHAAAMDATNNQLYYIFLKKNSAGSYTPEYIKVDATSSVGMWTDIQLSAYNATYNAATNNWYDKKPVISYLDKVYVNSKKAVKVAYVEKVSDGVYTFEAMTDPAVYEAKDRRTTVMGDVAETADTTATGIRAKVAVSFSTDQLVLDFLRDEKY